MAFPPKSSLSTKQEDPSVVQYYDVEENPAVPPKSSQSMKQEDPPVVEYYDVEENPDLIPPKKNAPPTLALCEGKSEIVQ